MHHLLHSAIAAQWVPTLHLLIEESAQGLRGCFVDYVSVVCLNH